MILIGLLGRTLRFLHLADWRHEIRLRSRRGPVKPYACENALPPS